MPKKVSPMVIEVHNSDKGNMDTSFPSDAAAIVAASDSNDKADSHHHSSSKSNIYKSSGEITNDSNLKSSTAGFTSSTAAAASNQIASIYDIVIPDDCIIQFTVQDFIPMTFLLLPQVSTRIEK
jgi:hypothetical protein